LFVIAFNYRASFCPAAKFLRFCLYNQQDKFDQTGAFPIARFFLLNFKQGILAYGKLAGRD
jgi:hypothetical protein